jgi:L-proline amide hydrolase
MAISYPTKEGFIPFKGYQTWYQIVGEGEQPGKLPLLCLHGGPGATHDYLESMSDLAGTGRRVIFYDQLGCGRSNCAQSMPEMWTVELFIEEINVVRKALGLDHLHLLGQSWGGMLLMEYLLTQPSGVASATIHSSPASMIQWVEEANRLRGELPPEIRDALDRHEAAGTITDPEYLAATDEFYRRHVCRVPQPDYVKRSFDFIGQFPEVYNTMNGPNEFHVVGTLKTWDIRHRLGEINAPVLVLSGRHDEATPLISGTVADGIPGAKWVIFEESSHMAHVEEPERFLQVMTDWMSQHEGK